MPNYLDTLLARVDDAQLRSDLSREVGRLRDRKEFGLVFERHLPETARLASHPIRRGVTVQERASNDSTTWTVRSVTGNSVELAREVAGEVINETRPIHEFVAVREFGSPIYPGLQSVGAIERGGDKPHHLVINGENYHALEAITFALESRVDVIYIDPPYNSGDRNWTYNNNYVDLSDQYRHSKWLSFMEKRLLLARRLLKPDSVLVVTIDEHEVSRLGALLSQLYPDADVTLVTIVNNPKGSTRPGLRRFSRVNEFAYFCFFGATGISSWGDDLLTLGVNDIEDSASRGVLRRPRWKGLLRSGTDARRQDRDDLFFPVLIDEARGAVVGAGDPLPVDQTPDFDTPIDGFTPVWPVRRDRSLGRWGVGHRTLLTMISKGYVSVGGHDPDRKTWALSYLSREPQEQIAAGVLEVVNYDATRNVVDVVYADPESASRRIKTVWHRTSHDAGVGGTDVITGFLGERRFSYPKSVYAVRDTLAMLTADRPDAVIVDFFAGSGTTMHAAGMLNSEDAGRRQTILITNNEVDAAQRAALSAAGHLPGDPEWEAQGVFQRVTKPRIEAAITGLREDGQPLVATLKNANGTAMAAGLNENVEFFDLTYLDRDTVTLGRAFAGIAPLLWIRAGATGPRIAKQKKGWALPAQSTYGILFDPQQWRDFAEAVRNAERLSHAFVVTNSLATFQQIVSELPGAISTTMLYEGYLSTFSVNTRMPQ